MNTETNAPPVQLNPIVEDAVRLVYGQQGVDMVRMAYGALRAAEQRGFDDGYDAAAEAAAYDAVYAPEVEESEAYAAERHLDNNPPF